MKLRANGPLSLRDGDGWINLKEGEEFTPPSHMKVEKALKRGIVEKVAPTRKSGRKAVESGTEEGNDL